MEIKFTAMTPTELKLTGRFILDLAGVREANDVGVNQGDAVRTPSAQEPEKVTPHAEAAEPMAQDTEKPKRARRTKAEMEADRAGEAAGETGEAGKSASGAQEPAGNTVAESPAADAPAADGKKLTPDDVRAALQGFVSKHGMPDAMTLLKTFGADRVSELKEDQFADFIEKASA